MTEGLIDQQTIVIPPDDKLLVAMDRLDLQVRGMDWLGPNHQQSSTLPPQAFFGRSNHSWPNFAKKKRSQAMMKAQKEYESLTELAQLRDARTATSTSSRSQAIMQAIDKNDVVFVRSENRSETHKEVPQIILDYWTRLGKGAECNIIVVQSRADAPIVAEKVAAQRAQTIGDQVGYEVEERSNLPQSHGSITFCTPGVLLRSLQMDRNDVRRAKTTIDNATHILLDNVQPRTIQMDLLLCFLKRMQARGRDGGKSFKIVFTSASIDLSNLRAYFTIPGDPLPPVIGIPSNMPPQPRLYLEDLMENPHERAHTFLDVDARDFLDQELTGPGPGSTSQLAAPQAHTESPPASVMALGILHALSCTKLGDVLVVLPSEGEVKDLQTALRGGAAALGGDKQVIVEIAKQRMMVANQRPADSSGREGVRYVILATPRSLNNLSDFDVACVVDSVLTRRRRYDPDRRTTIVETVQATKAEVDARLALTKGRGIYIGMVSRTKASCLRPLPEPEMRLSDLSAPALMVAGTSLPGISPDKIFLDLPERPNTNAVTAALGDLKMLGALDTGGHLTSLGRILCQLPLKPSLGKMLIYGALLRCLDPAITIAATINCQADLFAGVAKSRKLFSPPQFPSDVIAKYSAYTKWEELMQRGCTAEATAFVETYRLNMPALRWIGAEKATLFHALYGTGALWPIIRGFELPNFLHSSSLPAFNANKHSLATVSALIAVGLQPNIALAQRRNSFRIYGGQTAMAIDHSIVDTQAIGNESVSMFAYQESSETVRKDDKLVQLRHMSYLHPLGYVLLGATNFRQKDPKGVYVCDDWITIQGSSDFMKRLASLKSDLDRCLGWVYDKVFLREAWRRHQERTHRPVPHPAGESLRFPLSEDEYLYHKLDEVDQVLKSTVDFLDEAARRCS